MTTHFARQFVILLLLIIAVSPLQAASKGPLGTVRVGIFPFEPFNYQDSSGTAQGLNADLLREITQDEQWHVVFVPGSWAEGLERLEKQEIDLMVSVAHTPERAESMDYTYESVAELWGQVFVRPEEKSKNINDLEGLRVGVMAKDISGNNFIKTAEKFGVRCEIVQFANHAEVFTAVQKKEVAAGVSPQHFGLRHAKEYNLVGSSIMFSPFSIFFASKKGTQHELLSHIDAHLSRWKKDKDSFYYQRLDHWLGTSVHATRIPGWLIYSSLAAAVTILIAAGFILLLKTTVRHKTRDLAESEERHRNYLMHMPFGVFVTDAEGRYLQVNPAACRMAGYEEIELLTMSIPDLLSEDCLEAGQQHFQKVVHEGKSQGELTFRRKNGDKRWWTVTAVKLTDSLFLGFCDDITERKKTEEERLKLEAQLQHAQKIEAIGTLAGGIAHDFNNILGAILGFAEMARDDLPPGSTAAGDLTEILKAGHRAKELVKQILAFSRQAETERISLQPGDIVREAVKMLRPSLPSTIDIRQEIADDAGPVFADPSQLHQTLINLCTNSYQAMQEQGGILGISLKNTTLSEEDLIKEPQITPGDFVQISVSDTGPGMPPEIRERIFEPYFTTKETGKGTGLGLSIVHGIVKNHGGFISCYSKPGEGTVFHVFLPVRRAEATPEIIAAGPAPGGTEHILFVDDEEMLAEMARTMLERLGYRVTVKNSSIEALVSFQNEPELYDLVITDQTMPGMTGGDLARRLLQIRPGLPIILCTGFSTQMSADRARAMGIREFAMKPLAKKDIAALIRKVLDA